MVELEIYKMLRQASNASVIANKVSLLDLKFPLKLLNQQE